MRTVRLKVKTMGKYKKYGPDVYKVGSSVAPSLIANGWRFVHSTYSYRYLAAPAGKGTKFPVITATVPDEGEMSELVARVHAGRVECSGSLYDCRYAYVRSKRTFSRWTVLSLDGSERVETSENVSLTRFHIGIDYLWDVSFWWADGDDNPPERGNDWENEVGEVILAPDAAFTTDASRVRSP